MRHIIMITIDARDAGYLMKLVQNGRQKAEQCLRVYRGDKKLWEKTLEANKRIVKALDNAYFKGWVKDEKK